MKRCEGGFQAAIARYELEIDLTFSELEFGRKVVETENSRFGSGERSPFTSLTRFPRVEHDGEFVRGAAQSRGCECGGSLLLEETFP